MEKTKQQRFTEIVGALEEMIGAARAGKVLQNSAMLMEAEAVLLEHGVECWNSIRTVVVWDLEIHVDGDLLQECPPWANDLEEFLDNLHNTSSGTPVDSHDSDTAEELADRIDEETSGRETSNSKGMGTILFTPLGGIPSSESLEYNQQCLEVLQHLLEHLDWEAIDAA